MPIRAIVTRVFVAFIFGRKPFWRGLLSPLTAAIFVLSSESQTRFCWIPFIFWIYWTKVKKTSPGKRFFSKKPTIENFGPWMRKSWIHSWVFETKKKNVLFSLHTFFKKWVWGFRLNSFWNSITWLSRIWVRVFLFTTWCDGRSWQTATAPKTGPSSDWSMENYRYNSMVQYISWPISR